VKQVIVVNEALDLPCGKLAAQVAHAALAAFLEAGSDARRRWLEDGMPKVVLRADDEDSLLRIEAQAEQLGLPTARICDAGHTVVEPGTLTCIGIGPADSAAIDSVTGALKLLR
jgi:peptidyl-tRNA hydrolase, PTH2 family